MALTIPTEGEAVELPVERGRLRLTNLDKPFWPECDYTKSDLLRYYRDVAEVLLPHLRDRPMVMKRYPGGWRGEHFFMKRTPRHAPEWIETCSIEHASGNVIHFPLVKEEAALLWMVNLGCIDLNPWYARCDDPHRPDVLNFDLDPVPPASFDDVRRAALHLRELLEELYLPSFPKTSGSRGVHVYVPLARGPLQKEVWTFAKRIAQLLDRRHPETVTARYRIKDRPPGRVLVDYNQNAWGRTLASVYSVRPRAAAPVSAPVTWTELRDGIHAGDFRLETMRPRIQRLGDLWRALTWAERGRVELEDAVRALDEVEATGGAGG